MSSLQNTPEWYAARCGKATASRISEAVARTMKSGWSASRDNYAAELVYERIIGKPYPAHVSKAMDDGSERQPLAIAAYEFRYNCDVEEVGFVPHPWLRMTGASPDGRVGKEGLVEFKCPTLATHFDTLLRGKIKKAYFDQMLWQMACDPDRQWCDWCSFYPDDDLPPAMQLKVIRVERDNELISNLEGDVQEFLLDVDAKTQAMRSAYQLDQVLREATAAA